MNKPTVNKPQGSKLKKQDFKVGDTVKHPATEQCPTQTQGKIEPLQLSTSAIYEIRKDIANQLPRRLFDVSEVRVDSTDCDINGYVHALLTPIETTPEQDPIELTIQTSPGIYYDYTQRPKD